ncbi:GNAT family N-acetyltransferase [Streptomyces sp. NPDC005573]|uniref:GNAT family N-acetyltransferase n=1 Tax=Streptomyces sp. NPDC005573 TaxID=3156890 RepID=UPI0033B63657
MTDGQETRGSEAHGPVRLREVTEDDLLVFLAHEHDPEAVRRSRFTPRPREAFLTHWRQRVLGTPGSLVRTVTVGGEPAGNILSWTEEGRRFVGYWLGRAYWGRGVGTEALALFLDAEPVRPLYAEPHSGNTASIRLLERHGFTHVPTDPHEDDGHLLLVLGQPHAT